MLLRVEAVHTQDRDCLIDKVFHLVGKEDSLVLVRCDIHQRGDTLAVVWRDKTIQITLLDDGADFLICSDSLAGEVFLVIRHVLRLDFHAEAAGHGHIEAELQRDDAAGLVIGRRADVRSHRHGGEEIRRAPLHIDALQRVGVVAHPELVEVGQHAVVGTTAAAGTGLDDKVGIFRADAFASLGETAVEIDEEMRLLVGSQVGRAEVDDVHVGIPLDIGQVRVSRHQIIHDLEDEVLHLGVREVEHQLGTAPARMRGALGRADNPIGVFFVEFALEVGHLRFNPDAELDATLGSGLD